MTVSVLEGRRIHLRGIVQGVGMRPWIYRTALDHGITGTVCNETSGVTIEAFGGVSELDAFLARLRTSAPPAAVIDTLESEQIPPRETNSFLIVESRPAEERRVSIPPELATCDDCVAEILDSANRRYRYPFTNCTNCGPRFTIATGVPYDRAETTMGTFRMCPECQREYDDPRDRRFHAQPNACPVCGPRLSVLDGSGQPLAVEDPIRFAADQIVAGSIVAVKGLGGFHLACDATSSDAVARLRARKRRDEKPFAVMVADLEAAEQIVDLSVEARALLTSVERPIVIGPARPGISIAPEIAPRNPMLGVMLPYTPLHHLLLRDCGRPLVMTSANLSEEPIVYRNDEAVQRLKGVADVILAHDREIVTRCDDSVATVIAGHPLLLRRSRGYVPRAITLGVDVKTPVLATGALLKNTFCLAAGRKAWLGPHIGDLENEATYAAFEEAIDRMERFLGFRGEVVAHDLHPDYLSTRYARKRSERACVAVQHHHAHVASAVAEHRLYGPVIGVAFDGTGYGTDGTAWGGEFLVASGATFERLATFRPLALPGGDLAIRQPWRIALAALTDAFGRRAPVDAFPLFQSIRTSHVLMVRQMLDVGLNSPLARGVGRYFDAFGALAMARSRSRYEGQVAFEFNMLADSVESRRYTFEIDRVPTSPLEVDLRPAIREAARDVLDGATPATVSARFHNTLVAATAEVVRGIARTCGRLPVVLTGGCFQNARLAEGVVDALAGELDVHLHERVPPGDGGIALGQALVAAVTRL